MQCPIIRVWKSKKTRRPRTFATDTHCKRVVQLLRFAQPHSLVTPPTPALPSTIILIRFQTLDVRWGGIILTSFYKETKLRRRKKRRHCVSPSFLMRIQLPRKPPSLSHLTTSASFSKVRASSKRHPCCSSPEDRPLQPSPRR